MAAVRVVQITDTHLSHRRAYAVDNVLATLRWIAAEGPPDEVLRAPLLTRTFAVGLDEAVAADGSRHLVLRR